MRILGFLSVCLCMFVNLHMQAQTDFEKIEKACLLASSGLSEKGSPSELQNASRIMKSIKWSILNLQNVDVKTEVSVNGRMVFVPEFFDSIYVNSLVYRTAADYLHRAEENKRRGNEDVKLTTKGIAPNGKNVYGIRLSGNLSINLSAITEPYGAINMKVRIQKGLNVPGQTYSDNYNETGGYHYRKFRNIKSEGNKVMLIEISNCTDRPVNYALIMNIQKQ